MKGKMRSTWAETTEDRLPEPAKVCGGCGSSEERLLSLPGQLRSIAGAWWHIPCYNTSTPDAKDAAEIKVQEQWDDRAETWKKRGNRHCNGGPGGAKYQAAKLEELGPEEYEKRTKKTKQDTAAAKLKRSRIRAAQMGK